MLRSLALVAAAGAAAYYLYSRRSPKVAALPEDLHLAAQIRRRLDGVIADPGAIHVSVQRGTALLTGPVLPGERDLVLAAVLEVPGVMAVTNRLEPVEPRAAAI